LSGLRELARPKKAEKWRPADKRASALLFRPEAGSGFKKEKNDGATSTLGCADFLRPSESLAPKMLELCAWELLLGVLLL
jgi:hypothetical protein